MALQLFCQSADRVRVARDRRIAVGAAVFQRDPVGPDVAFFENMRDGVPLTRDLQSDARHDHTQGNMPVTLVRE